MPVCVGGNAVTDGGIVGARIVRQLCSRYLHPGASNEEAGGSSKRRDRSEEVDVSAKACTALEGKWVRVK